LETVTPPVDDQVTWVVRSIVEASLNVPVAVNASVVPT
jgi:hypothetical protein